MPYVLFAGKRKEKKKTTTRNAVNKICHVDSRALVNLI